MLLHEIGFRVKIEEDCLNYQQFHHLKAQPQSEVKIQHFENQPNPVKIEEDHVQIKVFQPQEDRVKLEELTNQEEKRKRIKKFPKIKPQKTQAIVIQRNLLVKPVQNKKKCKDKRKGKYEQSLAQKFIKKITGYHYCKNFNQFYHKQMSVFIKEKNQGCESEMIENKIHEQKPKIIHSITRSEFNELNDFMLLSVKAYDPYMKKYKLKNVSEVFEGQDFRFFETFFKSLFKKVYEIMIKVTYRKCLGEFIRTNINEMEITRLNYNGLDECGEAEISQAFGKVFEDCMLMREAENGGKREWLRQKLEDALQMQ